MIGAVQPAASRVRISLVTDFDQLEARRDAWNALAARARTSTIFQTYEWHASWWRVYGGEARPWVLLAESEGELCGIAPLMLSERRVLGRAQRVVEFIGTRMSDYCDFLVPDDGGAVAAQLLAALESHGFDLLHLRDIPESSTTRALLERYYGEARGHVDVRVLYEAPALRFGDPVADRRMANKKSLRRHYNYFRRSGTLEFVPALAPVDVPRYLETLFALHIARWAATPTPSLFCDERNRRFFEVLVESLADTGWLLFSAVVYDGRPVALHLGFEYGDRVIWYKPAFDVAYARHSPGEVLIKYLIEYAVERKVGQLDFTIGEDEFKYRFANSAPRNFAVRVFRNRADLLATRVLLGAKDRLESMPVLARLGRRILGRWRDHLWM